MTKYDAKRRFGALSLVMAWSTNQAKVDTKVMHEVFGHSFRVGLITHRLAEASGDLNPFEACEAGFLHDFGKFLVPADLILAPRKLNDEEFNEIKQHSPRGADWLMAMSPGEPGVENLQVQAARYHHEKWDGTGYHGLAGDDIPLIAQYVAFADQLDALRSSRIYRPAWSHSKIRDFIDKHIGRSWSPRVTLLGRSLLKEIFELVDYAESI